MTHRRWLSHMKSWLVKSFQRETRRRGLAECDWAASASATVFLILDKQQVRSALQRMPADGSCWLVCCPSWCNWVHMSCWWDSFQRSHVWATLYSPHLLPHLLPHALSIRPSDLPAPVPSTPTHDFFFPPLYHFCFWTQTTNISCWRQHGSREGKHRAQQLWIFSKFRLK